MRTFVKIVPIMMGAALFLSAAPVQAADLSEAQVQAIIGLLQSFNADASTISNVQESIGGGAAVSNGGSSGYGASSNTGTVTSYPATTNSAPAPTSNDAYNDIPVTTPSTSCVALTRSLSVGSTDAKTGGDVMRLQTFLGVSGANGYFGPKTLKAVQSWQTLHSIATSSTVGYGVVGPKTRAALACK